MLPAVLAVAALLVLSMWFVALADLVNATEMEPVGRVILALAVILAPPLGILLWMGVRGGRVGAIAAMAIAAFAVGIALSIAAAAMPGRIS